jgi:hypothetical protein
MRVMLKEYGQVVQTLRELKRTEALVAVQQLDDREAMMTLTAQEQEMRKLWQEVIAKEDLKKEMDWRERSRQLWLKEGDANTKYFHLATSARRRNNLISSIKIGDRRMSSIQEIQVEAS